tara:strand:- start:2144 stop:3214 length:1071 start_codon:yes stop_codon:yes gene_type:complete
MKEYTLTKTHEKGFKLIQKYNDFTPTNKKKLMDVKCRIDQVSNREWEISKKKVNDYEYIYTSSKTNKNICGIVPVSRSYFKLYEILKDTIGFNSEGPFACIAEGPGGFIHCLNDTTENNIYAITLISKTNKNVPFWNQQIINNKKNNLCYGLDDTGDIYNLLNAEHFIKGIHGKCSLITADGGFDYSVNYNSQEELSYRLLYSEIYIALNIQDIQGNFIIKVFDLFNYKTIQLLYILYLCYEELSFHKPLTSRLSNSEKYIICKGFQGCTESIRELLIQYYNNPDDFLIYIPQTFIKEIMKYNDLFITKQIQTIENIIQNIKKENKNIPTQQQINYAKEWCKTYDLPLNKNCIYNA